MALQSNSDPTEPLLRSPSTSTLGPASSQSSVREVDCDAAHRKKQVLRALAFSSAILSALCAGSTAIFSLYGHLFQSRLLLTQLEINTIASALSISLYVPIPLIGYVSDRIGPGPLSLFSVPLLGAGYGMAAGMYHKGEVASDGGARSNHDIVPPMVVAFVLAGIGSTAMYMSALTTCAKNFGKGRYRGLMLVAPIAAIGLGGIILSQIGDHLFSDKEPDGQKGDVNVFRFFIFMTVLLCIAGLVGAFALRVVDEDKLIEEAVDVLERSGILEGSTLSRVRSGRTYGTTSLISSTDDADLLDPAKDDEDLVKVQKTLLLNEETKRFLTDHTMWLFALGFWLIIGPGEAFVNNLGTVLGSLRSPGQVETETSAATHVSIFAATSTVARLLAGSLSDLLSPDPQTTHPQVGGSFSLASLRRRVSVSRVTLELLGGVFLSIGTIVLASSFVQGHASRFWIVSGSIGAGYGAVFSLSPIIITMIWGVENFGTNWGIVALFPAIGSTMWGLIYAALYQAGAKVSPKLSNGEDDVFCYGQQCYSFTFWAMSISIWVGCFMVFWAWKGRNGWASRGVII